MFSYFKRLPHKYENLKKNTKIQKIFLLALFIILSISILTISAEKVLVSHKNVFDKNANIAFSRQIDDNGNDLSKFITGTFIIRGALPGGNVLNASDYNEDENEVKLNEKDCGIWKMKYNRNYDAYLLYSECKKGFLSAFDNKLSIHRSYDMDISPCSYFRFISIPGTEYYYINSKGNSYKYLNSNTISNGFPYLSDYHSDHYIHWRLEYSF